MNQPKFKKWKRPAGARQIFRRRFCRMCRDKIDSIDYKDIRRLERLITDRGKIVSRRSSGNCARHQRRVARAVKRARFIALLPYVK
jgi:small subunit ribosomal protein S18